MKQIEVDYHKRQKGNWRRTIWNDISERITQPKRDCLVIYLAGHQNLDRDVAVSKGFRPENLISAERDERVRRAIRESGGLCVAGEFFEVIKCLAERQQIDVVYGDFCCGLESLIKDKIISLLSLKNLRLSVFAFNFMRGRDASSNELRSALKVFYDGKPTINRGVYLMGCIIHSILLEMVKHQSMAGIHCNKIRDFISAHLRAEAHSYKSGNLTFDSAVFVNPMGFEAVASRLTKTERLASFTLSELPQPETIPLRREDLSFNFNYHPAGPAWAQIPTPSIEPSNRTAKSLRAILAHRTMRLNGTFPTIQ